MALWGAVCSVTTRAIKFPGTCFKSKQWRSFVCFFALFFPFIWMFHISVNRYENAIWWSAMFFCVFFLNSTSFFFFLTIASAQQSLSSWIFCILWLQWYIMSSWFISHGGSVGRNIILDYITGRICGFANGLLKKLSAKWFDSFHFSILNIKANRINFLRIKILP